MKKILLSILFLIMSCGSADISELSSANNDNFTDEAWWTYHKDTDSSLNKNHRIYKYFQAAKQKKLAGNFFRDLIRANANIKIVKGDWPSYQPGFFSGGTIKHPAVGKSFQDWKRGEWASFYNEIFHAWWGNVFMKSSKYEQQRKQLLTAERKQHYKKANPRNPLLAQEEAYSETINTLMYYASPQYNPHGDEDRFYALSYFLYNKGTTVAPVSHSDRPGFTAAAEQTYPNEFEWKLVFKILFDADAP